MAQWVAPLTRNVEVVGSSPIKGVIRYSYSLVLIGTDSSVIERLSYGDIDVRVLIS